MYEKDVLMLKKFCPYPGCCEMIPASERFCKKHQEIYASQHPQEEAARQKRYDTTVRRVRDADITAFYHSQEWVKLQPVILERYHGLDLWAYYDDHKIAKAEMVHHILPVRTNWSDRLSIGNLIPLSDRNHAMVEQLYRTDRRRETQEKLHRILRLWMEEFRG